MPISKNDNAALGSHQPPFETHELRKQLTFFLDSPWEEPGTGRTARIGSYKWGVYAFYDYDGEPIYVGQTYEQLRSRIRRHLTNQRTDAAAMSVLDPFEVFEIELWPLPEYQNIRKSNARKWQPAKEHLDALEYTVFAFLIDQSRFNVILNEKNPPLKSRIEIPPSVRKRIVSDAVFELRRHPDSRLARRALIISRLAQVISEREVKHGLRRVLVAQAKRLAWLAERRFESLGGAALVETENEPEPADEA